MGLGGNKGGNNAFFVRSEKLGTVAQCTVEEGFVRTTFRDCRDKTGQLAYLSGDAQQAAISHLEVLDLELNRRVFLREIFLADESCGVLAMSGAHSPKTGPLDLPPLNGTASRETIWGWSEPREATNATRKEGTG